MGMHFGLVAVKAPLARLREVFPEVWNKFEVVASAENFTDLETVWTWMEANEHFVSAAAWTKENPGTQSCVFCQDGPWAVLMDPSYTLASDEDALKKLSEHCGIVLSFVVETAGGCAFFWCYEAGTVRRSIIMPDAEVTFVGEPMPEETGIDVSHYYMEETKALMAAFGLTPIEELPNLATAVAIAVADRTDYSYLKKPPSATTPLPAPTEPHVPARPSPPRSEKAEKPWWRFW
jgi:hypothetical protein